MKNPFRRGVEVPRCPRCNSIMTLAVVRGQKRLWCRKCTAIPQSPTTKVNE